MLRSPLILTLSSRLQAVFVVCDKIPQPIKVLLVSSEILTLRCQDRNDALSDNKGD